MNITNLQRAALIILTKEIEMYVHSDRVLAREGAENADEIIRDGRMHHLNKLN
jgi:hypothetical protein